MHEMSLMAGVFGAIDTTLAEYRYDRVTRVKLQVGKFTNAEPSALEFAFQAFAKGTKAEGAELEIIEIPVVGRCTECEKEFNVAQYIFQCPNCHGFGINIVSGQELILESLEVE